MSNQQVTVGRMVLFRQPDGTQVPAVVVAVHENEMTNLQVMSDGPGVKYETSVEKGSEPRQWDWMPFQKDQQARLAKEEAAEETAEETKE